MEAPRDLPKLEDIILDIHAARQVLRGYEYRLDRLECAAAEAFRRRYQRNSRAEANSKRDPRPGSTRVA